MVGIVTNVLRGVQELSLVRETMRGCAVFCNCVASAVADDLVATRRYLVESHVVVMCTMNKNRSTRKATYAISIVNLQVSTVITKVGDAEECINVHFPPQPKVD